MQIMPCLPAWKGEKMRLFVKRFEELSLQDLYEILKVRTAVFVVEQNCPYQDPDDFDQDAVHVFLKNEEGIRAYLRVIKAGVESEHVSIGRVLTLDRRQGLGIRILSEGMRVAKEYFAADRIYLEAQTYAKGLYEKLGFRVISGEFLLDGIPHVKMLYEGKK